MASLETLLKSATARKQSGEGLVGAVKSMDLLGEKALDRRVKGYEARDKRVDAQIPDITSSKGIDPRDPSQTPQLREYLFTKKLRQLTPDTNDDATLLELWNKSFGSGKKLSDIAKERDMEEEARVTAAGVDEASKGGIVGFPVDRKQYMQTLGKYLKLGLNPDEIDSFLSRKAKGDYDLEDFAAHPELFPKDSSKEMFPAQIEMARRKRIVSEKPFESLAPLPSAYTSKSIARWTEAGFNDAQIKTAIKENIKSDMASLHPREATPQQRSQAIQSRINEVMNEPPTKYRDMELQALRELQAGK